MKLLIIRVVILRPKAHLNEFSLPSPLFLSLPLIYHSPSSATLVVWNHVIDDAQCTS